MSADEFDRPAERLVRAASAHIASDPTVVVRMPQRVKHACRTKVDGVRCSHPRADHLDVGHSGWRNRCRGCRCSSYRSPIGDPLLDIAIVVVIVLLAAGFFWRVIVPALVEVMT